MEVEGHNARKVTKLIFFKPELPKFPKIDFFLCLFQKQFINFSGFSVGRYIVKCKKIMKPDFFEKILFGPNCPKLGIFGPKIDFFIFFLKNNTLNFSSLPKIWLFRKSSTLLKMGNLDKNCPYSAN